ncbi:putative permease often clustered with de novo purine synthesis [Sulfuriferula multivorans]|uniref:Putative permease often clustered with de novo purine synthesis n=1 Tax=Sulfuriferula multivorans TaxID=1559896 RepID=A0A401JHQ3_9PROT|nr:AI-2E family transporter [Sulfuriferula multivorans]GBL47463.1 putative permease often clustered with de novo purine synthesis [Sulfuriferula multivorans]
MNATQPNRDFAWILAAVLVTGGLLYLLSPILTPFLLAAILAYICHPLADRLERMKLPRGAAAGIVIIVLGLVFFLLALILLPMIQTETSHFIASLPRYVDWLQNSAAPWLQEHLGVTLPDAEGLKQLLSDHLQGAGSAAGSAAVWLKTGTLGIVSLVANLVLIPVVFFYLLRDWDVMIDWADGLVPRRWHSKVRQLATEIDAVLSEFLRGQLSVMLIMAVFYTTGLWIAGLDYALPIGILAGLLVFVPYMGAISGMALATLAGLVQFSSLSGMIPVWVVFGIGQLVEGYVVVPRLVGERIGLHPVMVIFALLAFGEVFGFFGVLLALPISAMLLVALRHIRAAYQHSSLYQD